MARELQFRYHPAGAAGHDEYAEMTDAHHHFILSLIEEYKPRKILLAGVSAGSTDAFILTNTATLCSPPPEIYAIDISEKWYRNGAKQTGWRVEELCSQAAKSRYHLLLGKDLVNRMEEVGGGIDFCVLDTVHALPGELLQFFAVYPYLAEGAVLVLHDLSLNLLMAGPEGGSYGRDAYATKVLFCSLASRRKYIINHDYPQIGAIIIDDMTGKSIESAICALGISWHYYPHDLIPAYQALFDKYYPGFAARYFERCAKAQEKWFQK